MKVQLKKSLQLRNARNKDRLTLIWLGAIMFGLKKMPELRDNEYYKISVTMSHIKNGKIKEIKLVYLERLANALGVDYNFILGAPSIHDEDYKRLCEQN